MIVLAGPTTASDNDFCQCLDLPSIEAIENGDASCEARNAEKSRFAWGTRKNASCIFRSRRIRPKSDSPHAISSGCVLEHGGNSVGDYRESPRRRRSLPPSPLRGEGAGEGKRTGRFALSCPGVARIAMAVSTMPQRTRWTWVRAGETRRRYVPVEGSTAASMPPTVPPTRTHVPLRVASLSFMVIIFSSARRMCDPAALENYKGLLQKLWVVEERRRLATA